MPVSIRLLFLTAETCPTYRADVNVLFGKYLPRHGVFADIVAGRTSGAGGDVQWGGGEAYLCDLEGGATKKHIKTMWHGIRHLFRADRTRYQAIQVRDMPVLAAFGLLAARIKGLPFYYWMSYPMPEGQIAYARERGLSQGIMKFLFPWVSGRVGRFLLYRLVLHRADHVFVQSERMKEDMAAKGVYRANMTPVQMGVDLEGIRFEEIRPVNNPRLKGRRVLVYLGTLDRPRHIDILFEMLALLIKQVPDVLLALVGDTQDAVYRDWLRQKAVEADVVENILWTGWLPMMDGWRYVRAAEVALSPFPRSFLLDSASPTKVPEYLALGVPVVCNDNPDQASAIDSSGAGLCVPYTAKDFADAVRAMLATDDQTRNAMIKGGRHYVAEKRDYRLIGEDLARRYRALQSGVPSVQ
jgi:glycosyltransferase involved in cell wall biosynthesis